MSVSDLFENILSLQQAESSLFAKTWWMNYGDPEAILLMVKSINDNTIDRADLIAELNSYSKIQTINQLEKTDLTDKMNELNSIEDALNQTKKKLILIEI